MTKAITETADAAACDLTTFYNGACPVCGTEIRSYARYAEKKELPLGWVDIDANPDALAAYGLSADDVKRRMYALDAAGRLHVGVDAFIVIWRSMPRYRWLARIVALPGLKQISGWLYDHVLAWLIYRWDKRRMARRKREAPAQG